MNWLDWYNSLDKPTWTPAPATIGLIWQILYPIILVSFGFVFVQAIRRKVPWLVALSFAINLVANLIFTPIQFGMRNLPLAAVDILIVWGTIIWMSVVIWRHYRWVAVARAGARADAGEEAGGVRAGGAGAAGGVPGRLRAGVPGGGLRICKSRLSNWRRKSSKGEAVSTPVQLALADVRQAGEADELRVVLVGEHSQSTVSVRVV
jgi:tryptophan-rich sensory protein